MFDLDKFLQLGRIGPLRAQNPRYQVGRQAAFATTPPVPTARAQLRQAADDRDIRVASPNTSCLPVSLQFGFIPSASLETAFRKPQLFRSSL